jgi:hypothetical protein
MPAFSHPVSSSASLGLGDEFRPAYGSRASRMDAVYVRQLEERAGRAVGCLLPVCGMGGGYSHAVFHRSERWRDSRTSIPQLLLWR